MRSLLVLSLLLLVSDVRSETIEGFAEPYRQVELAVGEGGVISDIAVEKGDQVRAGQLLASLDNRVLAASLAIARKKSTSSSSHDVALAEYDLYVERLVRIRLLRQRGHATQSELTRAQADVDIAEARLRHAGDEQQLTELDCERIEAQIAQRQVISPFNGVVIDLHREEGEPTLVTDPRIVTLAQLHKLRVKFPATPAQVAQLREQQAIKVKLAEKKDKVHAVVEKIGKTIDAKSGTLEVQVVIDNPRQEIRSGARCLMDLDVAYAANSNSGSRSGSATTESVTQANDAPSTRSTPSLDETFNTRTQPVSKKETKTQTKTQSKHPEIDTTELLGF